MKIQNLKTKVIGPILLLIPMTCMHLGDDHPSGHPHFSAPHPSYEYSTHELATGNTMGSSMIRHDGMTAQETTTHPEGEREG